MDHPVMYRGRKVPATHLVTVIAKAETELLEWEKGNIRDFISKEIESCYDASMKKLFSTGKSWRLPFVFLPLIPHIHGMLEIPVILKHWRRGLR